MTWDEFVAVMLEDADEETIDEETMERLYELHINPLNLNIATKADMDELPFLAEEQIEDILHYVERNGQMISLGELMMIKSLSKKERDMLRLFVKAEIIEPPKYRPPLQQLLKYSSHETVWRTDIPFYTKEGYKDVSPDVLKKSPNKVYRGDNLRHAFRYAFLQAIICWQAYKWRRMLENEAWTMWQAT